MRALGDYLPARAGQDDLVFLFFAGHGAPEISPAEPDGYAKYLVLYDAQPESLFSTALPMEMVRKIFSRIRARTLIFAADTCYRGAAGGRTRSGRSSPTPGVYMTCWETSGSGARTGMRLMPRVRRPSSAPRPVAGSGPTAGTTSSGFRVSGNKKNRDRGSFRARGTGAED